MRARMRTRVKVILASTLLIRVKWFSTVTFLISAVLSAMNALPWNFITAMIGAAGWTMVGFWWKDRSLMVLNAFTAAMMIAAWANYIN